MRKVFKNRSFSALLPMVLVAAIVLSLAACGDSAESSTPAEIPADAVTAIGQGEKTFTLEVYDADGNVSAFNVSTDAQFVGDALLETGLVEGEDSQYGLFILAVNGISLDYDKDGLYWAFYEDGNYASAGVDMTEIDEGVIYSLKAQK